MKAISTPKNFEDDPEVLRSAAALKSVEDALAAHERDQARDTRTVQGPTFSTDPSEPVSAEEFAAARIRLLERPLQIARLRPQLLIAKRHYEAARQAAKAALREANDEARRPLVTKLDAALAAAAAISQQLARLDEEAQRLETGAGLTAWPELAPETPLMPSRLESWRRHAVAHGLL